MSRVFFSSLRVENFFDPKFKCSIRSDYLYEVIEIKSILYFHSTHLTSSIIFPDDSEIILFFDLAIFFKPDSFLPWISYEKPWGITTVRYRKYFFTEFIGIISLTIFYSIESSSICSTDSGNIIDRLASSLNFEGYNSSISELLHVGEETDIA